MWEPEYIDLGFGDMFSNLALMDLNLPGMQFGDLFGDLSMFDTDFLNSTLDDLFVDVSPCLMRTLLISK